MGIFNPVQQEKKRSLTLVLRDTQNIFHLCIGICRRISDYSLVLSRP
jgi:hypothetical protein